MTPRPTGRVVAGGVLPRCCPAPAAGGCAVTGTEVRGGRPYPGRGAAFGAGRLHRGGAEKPKAATPGDRSDAPTASEAAGRPHGPGETVPGRRPLRVRRNRGGAPARLACLRRPVGRLEWDRTAGPRAGGNRWARSTVERLAA